MWGGEKFCRLNLGGYSITGVTTEYRVQIQTTEHINLSLALNSGAYLDPTSMHLA